MTERPPTEGWQRNVWALSLCVFIAFVGFQFFSPFLPLYIRELGVTDPAKVALWAGAIAAITPIMSGVLAPVFGRLADRFGRKMMLIRSLVGFTFVIAAMGLVTSVQQLFAARLIMGFFAGFTPMTMALASVSAPRDKVPVAIARVQGAQLLSVAIGPIVGGIAASRLGIRPAFYVTAGMCVVALIALIFLFREARPGEGVGGRLPGSSQQVVRSTPLRDFLGVPYFLLVMGLLLIAQFIDRGLGLLIPLHVAHMPRIEAVAATSGLIISVAAVGAAASASVAARLAQAIPVGRLMLGQFIAGAIFSTGLAFAEHWMVVLVLRTLVAVSLGGALTLAYSLGGMIVPAETRGAAFGWLALGVQVGTAASPLAMGAIAAVSIPSAYLVNAALSLGGAALLWFGARDLLSRASRT
jgi:MFS family permease